MKCSKCPDLLKERSEQLSVKVKEYVSDYQEGVQASVSRSKPLMQTLMLVMRLHLHSAKIGIIGGLGVFLAADAAFALEVGLFSLA